MTQFKGTPGPWRVNTIGEHWNNPTLVHLEVTYGTDGECVCDTVYRCEDADLIAAAPELLEALETLVVFTTPTKRNAAVLNKAYAAIAKATGETK